MPSSASSTEGLSIGELARSTGISRRALRHYHSLGLLVPAHRTSSGYRRYTGEEVSTLRQIQTLRGLGLSLYQIGRVLDGHESQPLNDVLVEQLRGAERDADLARQRRDRLWAALDALRGTSEPSIAEIIESLEDTAMQATAQKTIAILAYRDLQRMHDFLVDAFQMRPGGVQRDEGGRAVHAEVYAADGSAIWLHRHAPEHGIVSPLEVDKATGGVVVIVDDVDGHCRHAQERGAHIDYPPTDQDYGLREYGALDPEGGRWYFATPL